MSKKLTAKQIDAALYAIGHAEADADCDGFADRERSRELRMGVEVLTRLLRSAPEVLESLKELVHYDEGSSEQGSYGHDLLLRCKAAISKAEGGEQ